MNSESTATSTQVPGRRDFLRQLGFLTAGGTALAAMGAGGTAHAQNPGRLDPTDAAVLNFALNLEYLEAEFYLQATTGRGLEAAGVAVGENAPPVRVKKNPKVPFESVAVRAYAEEIAEDEKNHVRFIREVLETNGARAVVRPRIDLLGSFRALGSLIGVDNFDPFADDLSFLLAAYVFEDVGVTAYKGASPLVTNKDILEAAAGILGVEAYHAGTVRALLFSRGPAARNATRAISKVRQSLDNSVPSKDQGVGGPSRANIVPTDNNSVAYSRTTRQVLNIVYGAVNADKGLFFPQGLNGAIR